MNHRQKVVIFIGTAVVVIMFLFPPFHVQLRETTFNMGYGFILDPPKRGYVVASVNAAMLLLQWFGVIIVTGLGFLLSKSPEKAGSNVSVEAGTDPTESELSVSDEGPQVFPSQSDQPHPWRRFFARLVDLCTIGLLLLTALAFMVGATMPQHAEGFSQALSNPILAAIILYLVWLPAEAILISASGATPAKWLFGIRVLHSSGTTLSMADALKRSFLVWLQGEGLGLPLVALFTHLFAYRRLVKTGTTLWDTSVDSRVTHRQWGPGRSFACVLTVIVVLIIMSIMNAIGNRG